jgi:hypothetical protein
MFITTAASRGMRRVTVRASVAAGAGAAAARGAGGGCLLAMLRARRVQVCDVRLRRRSINLTGVEETAFRVRVIRHPPWRQLFGTLGGTRALPPRDTTGEHIHRQHIIVSHRRARLRRCRVRRGCGHKSHHPRGGRQIMPKAPSLSDSAGMRGGGPACGGAQLRPGPGVTLLATMMSLAAVVLGGCMLFWTFVATAYSDDSIDLTMPTPLFAYHCCRAQETWNGGGAGGRDLHSSPFPLYLSLPCPYRSA